MTAEEVLPFWFSADRVVDRAHRPSAPRAWRLLRPRRTPG
jgi:hypothetical protein